MQKHEQMEGWKRTGALKDINKELSGKEVIVAGFVRDIRDIGKIRFIVLADRDDRVQLIVKDGEIDGPTKEKFNELSRESTVAVKGIVRTNGEAYRGFEIIPKEMRVLSVAAVPLPMQISEKANTLLDTRLDWRFLDIRKRKNTLVFKVQTVLEAAMRNYWVERGFIEIHSPKLIGTASESGAELFKLPYFGREAYLAQSPQFYKQMAMAAGLDRVFEIAPVFRAEPSNTQRHVTEFTSVDMEMSWIDSQRDIMEFEQEWLSYAISEVKKQYGDEVREQFGIEITTPKVPFPVITLKEVKERVASTGKKVDFDDDLTPEEEKTIGKIMKEENGHEFVFVTEYPWKVKPFYHMRKEEDMSVTMGFDLLWNGLEITTGSQREHRYDVLREQAVEKGLNIKKTEFYLDFFKYGCPPHGGFGFGLTRTLMAMLNVENVREATFLARDKSRLFP